jgi:hypothetical protein
MTWFLNVLPLALARGLKQNIVSGFSLIYIYLEPANPEGVILL